MARIHAERAGTPAERALWRSVLDRLSAAAAVVALVVLAVHTGAHEGLLTALSPLALTAPSIHYAKWNMGSHGTPTGSFCAGSTAPSVSRMTATGSG
ncbi:DUF3693 domain-containing protein [Xanthomonas campestris pv. campestris]|nr:DUF3693 domain-containing protein [Xanthomonas campestris pv. campestris]MEA0647447.1 DUF3693 domain-containing protein [Xanthomonas campestris pv. campestris]MEA0692647.1 DUF3693 domain-containing protein [Xanthomonas campestris pv. campestris]